MKIYLTFLLLVIVILACTQKNNHPAQGNWIKGSEKEQIETIEKQFRGFDNAMVETAYRYQELYWAGQDENWDYAKYQIEKIKLTIENGLQRRPKRAKSAEHFLTFTLPEMLKAVKSKDTAVFNSGFQFLRTACKNCHVMENVPFIQSIIPTVRLSAVKFQKDK